MEILKFGGTSVGSCERMLHVLKIITNNEKRKVVVLSAMAGTTNKLKMLTKQIECGDLEEARFNCTRLKEEYLEVVRKLYKKEAFFQEAWEIINHHFEFIASFIDLPFSLKQENIISAQGELISTKLFHILCQERDVCSVLLPALDFMKINEQDCPDNAYIQEKLNHLMAPHPNTALFITQGYICKNYSDEVDNLGRGGSDYTATIIGAVLDADEVQIWTDIDGVHNNDPRYVNHTVPIAELSYDEASLLAYFGAKILHPTSVIPAKEKGIPLRVKNTFEPDVRGTLIQANCQHRVDCAVSLKDRETLIHIRSNNKLSYNKFLLKIFEICQKLLIEIDMTSVTHQCVTLVVSEKFNTDELTQAFNQYGEVSVDLDYAIVNVVGNFQTKSVSALNRIFNSLANIPMKMLSQKQGDCSHMQLLVSSKDQIPVLKILNNEILNNRVFSKIKEPIS